MKKTSPFEFPQCSIVAYAGPACSFSGTIESAAAQACSEPTASHRAVQRTALIHIELGTTVAIAIIQVQRDLRIRTEPFSLAPSVVRTDTQARINCVLGNIHVLEPKWLRRLLWLLWTRAEKNDVCDHTAMSCNVSKANCTCGRAVVAVVAVVSDVLDATLMCVYSHPTSASNSH